MPLQTLKEITIKSLAYTFAMLLIWILLNSVLTGGVWEGMEISKSALTVEYCEFNDTGKFFHQSINTHSNLMYFFFGIFICLIGKQDAENQELTSKNRLANFPELSFLIGISFLYLFELRRCLFPCRSLVLALLSIVSIVIALKIRTMDVQKINCDLY